MYERFLPALEARKQQFLIELAAVRRALQEQQSVLDEQLSTIASWSPVYWDFQQTLPYFINIHEVKRQSKNVAGLKIPEFLEVVFDNPPYSLFASPYSFELILLKTRGVISSREHMKILREQERIISEGFRKTSQRINLYEQKLIPDCREAIRKITVYLQDQQAAAVGVAKVAKRLSGEALY